jgi:hypothetical protein
MMPTQSCHGIERKKTNVFPPLLSSTGWATAYVKVNDNILLLLLLNNCVFANWDQILNFLPSISICPNSKANRLSTLTTWPP